MKFTISRGDNPFNQLKRKIYLYIVPLIIFTIILGIVLKSINQNMDTVSIISLPLLLCWLIVFYSFVLFKQEHIPIFEVMTLVFLTLFHLSRFYYVVSEGLGATSQNFDEYTFWIPMIFISIFLIFRDRSALYISILVYGLTLVIGAYFLITNYDLYLNIIDTIVQFYISNLVYIVSLYFLQNAIRAYIKSEQLQQMAFTDALTNLPNRRQIEQWLDQELNCAKENNTPLSVTILDIDNFKNINDRYGHDAGDFLLKEFSNVVGDSLRETTKFFGRWGGEEFIIITPNYTIRHAEELATQIKDKIKKHQFKLGTSITSSFGVTEFTEQDDAVTFLVRADKALYNAKNNGKNQVQIL
jgi:diguanylate cyclase (GGDEF)-like protein